MHRTDAAAVDALHAGGDLVMNVAGFEHGSRLVFPVLWRQSAFDSLLAIPENLGVVSFHSKWPFVGCDCCCDKLNSTSIYGHFELLFCNRSEYHAYNRASNALAARYQIATSTPATMNFKLQVLIWGRSRHGFPTHNLISAPREGPRALHSSSLPRTPRQENTVGGSGLEIKARPVIFEQRERCRALAEGFDGDFE